jgi:hypothetical protein
VIGTSELTYYWKIVSKMTAVLAIMAMSTIVTKIFFNFLALLSLLAVDCYSWLVSRLYYRSV